MLLSRSLFACVRNKRFRCSTELFSLSTISLACAFAVAAVFVVAAVTKLRSPAAVREATSALDVPGSVARFIAPGELVVATLLLLAPRVGAVAAVGLLVVFTALLRRALATGRVVRCGCFGAGSGALVTSVSIIRNVALIAASSLAWSAPSVRTIDNVELSAAIAVGVGVVCMGVLLHALAELRRITGSVFPHPRAEA